MGSPKGGVSNVDWVSELETVEQKFRKEISLAHFSLEEHVNN